MSMISLILPSLIVVNLSVASNLFSNRCIIFHLRRARRDTDNLLSASDCINFAFNFALMVTCKLKTILLIFYWAETKYT